MNNLEISSGAVELTIDNDPNRVIRFYPTDVEFAEAYFDLIHKFDAKRAEIKTRLADVENLPEAEQAEAVVAIQREVFGVLRDGIDDTFGPGTSAVVFGNRNNLTMVARFFRGVTPYVRDARVKEVERYREDAGEVLEC